MSQKSQNELAIERDKNDQCLVCGKGGEVRKRGLCAADYQKYRRAKQKVPVDKIEEWELKLINQGYLASDGRTNSDPFRLAAEEFTPKPLTLDEEAEILAKIETPVGRKKTPQAAIIRKTELKNKKAKGG